MRSTDTIFALSSGALPSGVAVIRLSGATAFDICVAVAGRVPPARQARLMTLRDAEGVAIDQALVLAFAGPASFTGEDCVEFVLDPQFVVQGCVEKIQHRPPFRIPGLVGLDVQLRADTFKKLLAQFNNPRSERVGRRILVRLGQDRACLFDRRLYANLRGLS